jgi:hypothetical protein
VIVPRTILSLPVAALVVGVVGGVGFAAMVGLNAFSPRVILSAIGLASVVALVHVLVLGVPFILVLKHFGSLKLHFIVPLSFLIGAFPIPIILLTTGSARWTLPSTLLSMLACGLLGVTAGVVWFYVSGLPSNKSLERTRDG